MTLAIVSDTRKEGTWISSSEKSGSPIPSS